MNADAVEGWLVSRLAEALKIQIGEVDRTLPLTRHGLDSLGLLNLTGDLAELLGRELPVTLVWEYPTIESLAQHLAVPEPDPIEFLQRLIREQGDVARYDGPYGPVCFFNHPDEVQAILHGDNFGRTSLITMVMGQGLLASQGQYWHAQRRLMQPLFHEGCLPAFIPAMTEATRAMLRRWDKVCRCGGLLDVAAEMRRLTLEIIVSALFSHTIEGEEEEWDAAMTVLLEDLTAISNTQFKVPARFTPSSYERFQQAIQTIDRKVHRMIDARRALDDKPRDLLSMLLLAKDGVTGQPLNDRQIRDEVVTMLIAGHETTAIALAWVWHLLAVHPSVEEQMEAELEQVLQGGAPTADDLPRLRYTRMVLEETMRLYPPVWVTSRQALADDNLAGCPIRAKTIVLTSAYTIHRRSDFWEEPERFDPGRFAPEKSKGRHRYAYMPFGGGSHRCIGQSFAMAEGLIILAMILPRWRIRSSPDHPVTMHPAFTLRPHNGLWMRVEPRQPRSVT